ncbi:MAG: aminotransferase class V-fold PLP-dependent enzyme [Bacteroidales bacterium]|nr:aminotransferase class V-fold PLP-dependent enzyme [Bacteroidales bacterium]
MEQYFKKFREHTIGFNQTYTTPYGEQKMIYADWVASGRLYKDIEDIISHRFGPFVANTHTETSETGTIMTKAYHHAKDIIRKHVNACENDILINSGFGMTGVVNKLQRILGLKNCADYDPQTKQCTPKIDRPVVFITHMEHHSNHTSWYETNADVVLIEAGDDLLVDLDKLRKTVEQYKDRELKIGAFTACSNVTGVETPYHEMAQIMHENEGLCFIDFAASAPYVDMNMHPENKLQALDAIFFSPHKFLGGPGSSGVLVFNKELYNNNCPDQPGGGTVDWTNAWGEYKYSDNIEAREDGGTPGFLQAIKTALSIELKDKMGVDNIRKREHELMEIVFEHLPKVKGINILADNVKERVGAVSFYIDNVHFNLVVKLLNDRFGIQVRGGCACAGTYGHILLDVSYDESKNITDMIDQGDLSKKPGWIRLSVHPTMTNEELIFICDAIEQIAIKHEDWKKDYVYDPQSNEFTHNNFVGKERIQVASWFDF